LVYLRLFGIFCGHFIYFIVIWYIFPVLICCIKKNLATLPRIPHFVRTAVEQNNFFWLSFLYNPKSRYSYKPNIPTYTCLIYSKVWISETCTPLYVDYQQMYILSEPRCHWKNHTYNKFNLTQSYPSLSQEVKVASFRGDGYVELASQPLRIETSIGFSFRTLAPEGLILLSTFQGQPNGDLVSHWGQFLTTWFAQRSKVCP
jgi:hypothetical protein